MVGAALLPNGFRWLDEYEAFRAFHGMDSMVRGSIEECYADPPLIPLWPVYGKKGFERGRAQASAISKEMKEGARRRGDANWRGTSSHSPKVGVGLATTTMRAEYRARLFHHKQAREPKATRL